MAEAEYEKAKAYLLQGGSSVYDHLAAVLGKLLDEQPASPLDILEEVSRKVKSEQYSDTSSTVRDAPEITTQVAQASLQAPLFKAPDEEEEEEEEPVVPDVVAALRVFEDAGVGLGREEGFRVYLALTQLAEQQPLKAVRFWGKILGLESNYYVAEVEYKDGEEPQPEEDEEAAEEEEEEGEEGEEGQLPLPKSKFVAPKPLPAEDYGTGANKKAYFVCSEPGAPWTALPAVMPAQIVVARQVKKFLTGRLDAAVQCYPPFSGTEANLLRAQIACITADTLVSPLGYYTFDEDDDDEEGRENFVVNEEFEPLPKAELLDPSLSGWVHHAPYILPQGRCNWLNPNPKPEDEGDEDDEEEEEEEEVEPETGPPLLQPLQSDPLLGEQAPWSVRLSSQMAPRFAAVVVSSNRWPGAHAYAKGAQFENVYVGWAQQFSSSAYSPPVPGASQPECPNGEEITEAQDPTREEEEAFEASQAADAEDEDDEDDEEDED